MQARVVTVEIFIPLEDNDTLGLEERAAAALAVPRGDIIDVRLAKRSLDARKGRPMGFRLRLEVRIGKGPAREELAPAPQLRVVPRAATERVVIAGSGPAGTFAALRLAEAGAKVCLVERGRAVQPRRHDIARLVRQGELDPDSNYCFGEGGAGTFSDGKLYTRTKDRAAVDEVLGVLVAHGADPAIRIDSRPHVGSNKLPVVLTALRRRLEELGVEYRWSDPVESLLVDHGRVRAVRLRSGAELACDRFVLAIGHSARDTFERLAAQGVAMVAKAFAVGVRIEHPQALIDAIQYGEACGHPRLPAAFYEVTTQVTANVAAGGATRGVYSFCMCPGGWIVDSSTEPGRLATNGMSLSRRDSPFANAALVVTVLPNDVAAATGMDGPLAGLAFQRMLEARAYLAGGGGFAAPAQRVTDFLAEKTSSVLARSSYRPRVASADLADVLPVFVGDALRLAVPIFDRTMRGFLSAEAQLVGVETRTSSPVRILRDARTCESPSHARLYPCGEGAGYAGGIVSSAIDGLRVANAILADLGAEVPAYADRPSSR